MISLLYNTPHEIIQHHDVTAKKYLRMEVYATDASSMIHFSRRFVLVENRVGACRMWHSVRTQFFLCIFRHIFGRSGHLNRVCLPLSSLLMRRW